MPQTQEQNGVTYITGGVGVDEAKDRVGAWSLQSAIDRNGKRRLFLADMPVKVINSRKQTVLDTTTDGPYLFAKLPAGRYEVITGDARVQKRAVQVGARGGANVHFVF